MFKSPDLVNWELMDQAGDDDGLIWNIETEGTWANQWKMERGKKRRAVWAPEVHYMNGNLLADLLYELGRDGFAAEYHRSAGRALCGCQDRRAFDRED